MRVDAKTYDLKLEVPFTISRGTTSSHRVCVAEIEHHGIKGYGEASPSAYYNDSAQKALETILGCYDLVGDDPFAVSRISEALKERFPESPSGRAAVEAALYDIAGKVSGLPLYRLLGLAGKTPPKTSFTVGIADLGRVRQRIGFLRRFPILKVKLGFGEERGLLELLRNETDSVLRVDVNEGWSSDEASEKIEAYSRDFSIEFFEQPLPKEDREGYAELRERTRATIVVDESISNKEDVLAWAGLADGINIKLMKCGGFGEALRMIAVARAAGLRVMLGCMVETSLGITAAAHIAPLVDYCDLDGNLLISNDPFDGVKASDGIIELPDMPGLGVVPSR
jgi:L-alanine-DL-glutamate epimerase-like enolase superfamily enzyme